MNDRVMIRRGDDYGRPLMLTGGGEVLVMRQARGQRSPASFGWHQPSG